MARRPGAGRGIELSPRARMLGGWLVALLLVLGIAGAVRFLGESSEDGSPTASGGGVEADGSPHPIEFGTALSPRRAVPVDARAASFTRGDTFAYAVPEAEPADEIFVEVARVEGGPAAVVQEPVEGQVIPDGPAIIGFSVPTDDLLDAWGAGAYEMRIYLAPDAPVLARGRFVLVEPASS